MLTAAPQFHCSTQSTDRIALIRETSICEYVMIIHTPRLCGEPLFFDGSEINPGPVSAIECKPVVKKLPSEAAPGQIGVQTDPASDQDAVPVVEAVEHTHADGGRDEERREHEHDDHDDDGFGDEVDIVTLLIDPDTGEVHDELVDAHALEQLVADMLDAGEDGDEAPHLHFEHRDEDGGALEIEHDEHGNEHLTLKTVADLQQLAQLVRRLSVSQQAPCSC